MPNIIFTHVYSSRQSTRRPLQYSDDSSNVAVNNFMNKIFKGNSNRVSFRGRKYSYLPSDEYKAYVIKIKCKK